MVAASSASEIQTRSPLAFNACGGGFTTMTQAMGLTRAIATTSGAWDQFTHVGSNSGGNWFSTQLFYSKRFWDGLTDTSTDLGAFVTLWGATYDAAMTEAVNSGAVWASEFSAETFDKKNPLCTELVTAVENITEILGSRGFPAWEWLPYIAAMLKPWVPDIETATYANRRMTGLTTATLSQEVSLVPDAFLDSSVLATRGVTYKSSSYTPDTPYPDAYLIPLSHVQPPSQLIGGSGGEWLMNDMVEDVTITRSTQGKDNQGVPLPSRVEVDSLDFDRDPLLVEVAAASSAAAGIVASPAMLEEWTRGTLDSCWPLGLETVAAPWLVPGYTMPTGDDAINATVDASDMVFRYIDGGYIEDTNAAFTLAKMQAECASSATSLLLDCSQNTYRMIIAGDSPQESLWYDPEHPPGTFLQPNMSAFNGPVPTMFAETFPGADAWVPYAVADLHLESGNTSYYWRGTLTSVENEWYGVAAGSTVEVLYFTGDSTPIDIPGDNAAILFETVYAPSAVAQAEGAAPLIKAFLEGKL